MDPTGRGFLVYQEKGTGELLLRLWLAGGLERGEASRGAPLRGSHHIYHGQQTGEHMSIKKTDQQIAEAIRYYTQELSRNLEEARKAGLGVSIMLTSEGEPLDLRLDSDTALEVAWISKTSTVQL
jgi:hypothetical protein